MTNCTSNAWLSELTVTSQDPKNVASEEGSQLRTSSSTIQRPAPIDMANLPNHVGAPYSNPMAELLEVDSEDADSAVGDVGAS